ncbi:BadF/BadG/BcrA/BcrD ATPase family protein [Pigmentibacter ruber]|uniref:BadF/BadG/BcrA/BcrD ATPase family protein n=1 Tax=Pigmentibacter ruber TaxID=2683196 RepID=UPI00131D8389|nr:BadF/BadG/BcrA/BcrD ATPase family protein [Pigmentibacter ruber]BFD32802.1 N-acetylglucosamine kinase [Pigmentibacter ruber]
MKDGDYFVGIDGGGSKTHLRIVSASGKVIAESFAGPANIRLSVDTAIQSITEALNIAAKIANISQMQLKNFQTGIGVAGYEVQTAREEFLNKIQQIGIHQYKLQSDAYIACLGAHNGNYGSIIIVGTGVVGLTINRSGKTQVGGWGFPHGDEGGAAWLGLETTRQLLHYCDGRAEPTPLLKYLQKKFANKVENITEWACYANASQFAELARDVFKYAKKNDSFAEFLLKKSAREVEQIYLALKMKSKQNQQTPFSILGGVAPFIFDYLKPAIKKQLNKPLGDACDGAILMIRKHINHLK